MPIAARKGRLWRTGRRLPNWRSAGKLQNMPCSGRYKLRKKCSTGRPASVASALRSRSAASSVVCSIRSAGLTRQGFVRCTAPVTSAIVATGLLTRARHELHSKCVVTLVRSWMILATSANTNTEVGADSSFCACMLIPEVPNAETLAWQ